jgi:hypothetical protein
MPKRLPGSADQCGIRYEGAVLNGQLSVQEAFSLEAKRLALHYSQQVGVGDPYADPNLDPVLRFHHGLDGRR